MTGTFSDDTNANFLDPEAAKAGTAFGDCQLVAVYNSNNDAHLARDALTAAKIPADSIHVIDKHDPVPAGTLSTRDARRTALLGAFGSLFSRSEHPTQFNLVADPNHAVVVLSRGPAVDLARARQILSSCSPVEIYDC